MQRQPRERDSEYLDFIRAEPCCICGDDVHVEAHHPRMTAGMAQRCDDDLAVPLCGKHHRKLHRMNEREFWASYGIDPVLLAISYQREHQE
jgi:hypothetical protein